MTCGSTRACLALAAGDVVGAFRVQPLATALLTAGAALALANSLLLAHRRAVVIRFSTGERRLILWAGGLLAVANWAYLLWRGV